MSIKIKFDTTNNPEEPTIILSKRNGDKLGKIDAREISMVDSMNDASEISFKVYKEIDGELCHLWEQIKTFKLAYCVEWDTWFEIYVEMNESNDTVKIVTGTRLGVAELSQIMLYNIEINTENDISRDEYDEDYPTVLYRDVNSAPGDLQKKYRDSSLLHRITEKAPHYSIRHVDNTIRNKQRTFEFNEISIYDAFQNIAEEINCLFVFHSDSDAYGRIKREFSVYDLESNCNDCGYRGEFADVCPKCYSTNINEGFGEDTMIFIESDEFADEIELTIDASSVKNCFKLEAGDDLLTATIRNCNPNGTDYIWYISDDVKSEMSKELVDKLESYDELYRHYQQDYISYLDNDMLVEYNKLVKKYTLLNSDLEEIEIPLNGYQSLMNAYYNTTDFELYLTSSLMPSAKMPGDTTAEEELVKLRQGFDKVSTKDVNIISVATADNLIEGMAKVVVDSRYKAKIISESSSLSSVSDNKRTWSGRFEITNYSDEEDTVESDIIRFVIDDDEQAYIEQKIEKTLAKGSSENFSIGSLFKKNYYDFCDELKKYSLNRLKSFEDACQSCIDILIDQGVSNKESWNGEGLYAELWLPYQDKKKAITKELSARQSEIDLIVGIRDSEGNVVTRGMQDYIIDEKNKIQMNLNFEDYIGTELWYEFCAFRRDDKYSNENYTSDGLNNAGLFIRANEFIEVATKDIYKSAELQRSITANLKNLLVMDKFKPLVDSFEVGNWLRIMADGEVYKLRLISYTIDYSNMNNISVEFSDVTRSKDSIEDIKSILSQASSMATSYSSVKRQAEKSVKSSEIVSDWVSSGLDTTNTKIIGGADNQTQMWDRHGMLFREYDDDSGLYSPTQLKIVNSTVAITNDDWETTKTAIGRFNYIDPVTNEENNVYGINGEVIVGKMIIGENLGIYSEDGNMTFNGQDGLSVSNDKNSVTINPNKDDEKNDGSIFTVKRNVDNKSILSFNDDGNLHIEGEIYADDLVLRSEKRDLDENVEGLLYVNSKGEVNSITISRLKMLLGI